MTENPVAVLFSVKDSYVQAAVRDLFALGCYLHVAGDKNAGAKACATALRAARAPNEQVIVSQLPERAAEFARACFPHSDLITLLERDLPGEGE